jgi:RNA polymerase sigma-70 factor (ECF subfamily)
MHTTPVSLLERLRQPDQPGAWNQFVELYTPLLYRWARRMRLPSQEAADLVQDVLVVLVRKLPEFRYDQHQSFRGWLHTVTLNKYRETLRRRVVPPLEEKTAALSDLAVPDDAAEFGEEEYRRYLVGRALQVMRDEFQPATWQACWEYVVAGRPAADVAAQLGLTANAVRLSKVRVLRLLRRRLEGLLD